MKITDSTPFVLVTYVIRNGTHCGEVTCCIRGHLSILQAVRAARAKLRTNHLTPITLLGVERVG